MTGDSASHVSKKPIDNALEPILRFRAAADKASRAAAPLLPRSAQDNTERFAAGKPRRRPNARANRPAASRCRQWLWNAASILSLAVALICLAPLPPFGGKSAVDPEPTRLTAATAGPSLPTIPIERIRPGDWALAHNPELTDEQRWAAGDGLRPEVNPDGWWLISMRLQKDDDGYVDIELLRPVEWIERHQVEVGGQVDVELTELGGAGSADVFNIRACPPIGPLPGAGFRMVTGRYAHSAGDTFDLRVNGLDGQPDLTIGVTATHPIWSVDEDDFVAAGDLLPGERLLTASGQIAHVHSLTPRPAQVRNPSTTWKWTSNTSTTCRTPAFWYTTRRLCVMRTGAGTGRMGRSPGNWAVPPRRYRPTVTR